VVQYCYKQYQQADNSLLKYNTQYQQYNSITINFKPLTVNTTVRGFSFTQHNNNNNHAGEMEP
jgi:hypothetical protein